MIIHVSGTPYQMGFTHGKMAAKLIRDNMGLVRQIIEGAGMPWDVYDKYLLRNLSYLKKNHPDFVEEFQGIADGAGLTLYDIALTSISLYFQAKTLPRECSTFIARGPATLDHKTYIVKNRDMGCGVFKHVVLHRDFGHFQTTEVHAAGTITYPGSGMNSYGLATSQVGMWSPNVTFEVPPLTEDCALDSDMIYNEAMILRECRNVEDVIRFVDKADYLHGLDLFAIDGTRAVVFEIMIDQKRMFQDENGILVRTNNFVHPDYADIVPDKETSPGIYTRYERGMSFLQERHGGIRFQDMLQLAGDHENGGGCICRHGGEAKGFTSYSSICVLEDRQLWTSFGPPCEALVLDALNQ